MKTYKGRKRIAYKVPARWKKKTREYHKRTQKWTEQCAKTKPGDYISVCFGYNVRVVSVHFEWEKKGSKTSILRNVEFIDANGRMHSTNSCVYPLQTNDEILAYWFDNFLDESKVQEIKRLHESGVQVLTEFGEPTVNWPL